MINVKETREHQLAEEIREAVQQFNLLCKEASALGMSVNIGQIIGGNGQLTIGEIDIKIIL